MLKPIVSIPSKIALLMIRIYQKLFSFDHSFWAKPEIYRACIHYPSCSEYTYEAIEKYGLWKGVVLGSWRVLRCNPFTKGGFDPVPKSFSFRKQKDLK